MDQATPLSETELDELDDFLMSNATGEDAMDLSMLDGFLTALAIGPHTVPADEWLPMVWGRPVRWPGTAVAEHMTGLVLRHANHLSDHLRHEPDLFEPMLLEREVDGKAIPIIDEWCTGFMKGIELDAASWQFFRETEEGTELLHPFWLYGTEAGWDELAADPELAARHNEHAAALGENVIAILQWWLPVRMQGAADVAAPDATGDLPCPCGSGDTFRTCCGRDRTLH